jgi:Domain of unknown function (DUF5666)
MKKLILVVALLTVVAFASGVMAQQKAAPAPAKPAGTAAPAPAPAPAKPAKAEKFSGTVDKVDEAAKTVVVKGKKDDKTFVIDAMTKIMKGKKEMAMADLKNGTTVSVEYKMDGDKMMATAVKITGAPKAAPKAKKEKAEKPMEKPADAPKK